MRAEPANATARRSVLVVEDDPQNAAMLNRFLRSRGYSVALAEHGLAALEYLRAHPGDIGIILLDLRMPVMDGLTFRAEQRRDQTISSLPVVLVSAEVDFVDPALFHALVQKPIHLKGLLEIVQRLLPDGADPLCRRA